MFNDMRHRSGCGCAQSPKPGCTYGLVLSPYFGGGTKQLGTLSGHSTGRLEERPPQSAITSESINPPKLDLTDEPLESLFENDLVWWVDVPEWDALPDEELSDEASIFMSERDALLYLEACIATGRAVSGTFKEACQDSLGLGATWLVLRSSTLQEIDRWRLQ